MDMADPRSPTEHHLTRARQATGPAPAFGSLAAEVSTIEHLITEALVAQERRLMLRLETAGKAQESAELTMARRSARRRGAWAVTLGTAAGAMAVVFSTAWGVFRDTRNIAETAATQVVEEKAVPIAIATTASDVRVTAVEARQTQLEQEVGAIRLSTDRILELLEPPVEVVVPRRRVPR